MFYARGLPWFAFLFAVSTFFILFTCFLFFYMLLYICLLLNYILYDFSSAIITCKFVSFPGWLKCKYSKIKINLPFLNPEMSRQEIVQILASWEKAKELKQTFNEITQNYFAAAPAIMKNIKEKFADILPKKEPTHNFARRPFYVRKIGRFILSKYQLCLLLFFLFSPFLLLLRSLNNRQ